METASTEQNNVQSLRAKPVRARADVRFEHLFFPGMAAFILISVFVGFAQTYYLHAFLRVPAFKAVLAPPFPWIVHLHGVVFSSWIILLMVQTSLVASHRVDLHRRLGLIAFGLACLMVCRLSWKWRRAFFR